jgi:hypothetical protein
VLAYLGRTGTIFFSDLFIKMGKVVFSYTLGSPVGSSPALAQNHLLIGYDNGNFYAFTAESDF